MKLTIILCLFSVVSVLANKTYSQTKTLKLNMQDATVKEVLSSIEEQSEFYFMYSEKVIDVNRKVDVNIKNQKVAETLNSLFKGTDVEYTINDRIIILTTPEIYKTNSESVTQQNSISGTVTDESGQSLPGVTVIVKGTTQGMVTNADGEYSIPNIPEDATLQFSFVGMQTQEVEVGNQTTIDITMAFDAIGLEEVVAVGYGTMSKKNLTTSISQVKTEEITKATNSNVGQLMLGRASGVQALTSSAQPGGNVDVSIRGAGTPIYVVDGIVVPSNSLEAGAGGSMTVIPQNVDRGGLAGLNPEDIETVEVLKDASSSIYGIGAANGVILITTKKGKEGPVKVSYEGSYSLVKNINYVEQLNAQQYMDMVNIYNKEAYLFNSNMSPYGNNPNDDGWSPVFGESEIQNAQTTNWIDEVLRDGSTQNHSIVLNGGAKNVNYYISGNYFDQEGTVSNSSMKRYTFRSNTAYAVNDFIKLTALVNANRNNYNNSMVGGPTNGRGNQAGGALIAAITYPSNIPVKNENGEYSLYRNVPNPVAMEDIMDETTSKGVYLNFATDISLVKNMLNAKLLYGNNYEATQRSTYIPSSVYYDQMYKSRGNLGNNNRMNQTFEATLSFNKAFNDILVVDAVLGAGKYLNNGDGLSVSYDGQHDAIRNENLSAASGIVNPNSFKYSDEKRSQFIRASFDLFDKYVIATTLRRDGTDKFFPNEKYALFPSVSAAWKLSNENFLKNVNWLDLLKVRASYGTTGSDNLGTTLYGTYGPSGKKIMFDFNSVQYIPIVLNGRDYPNVSWQKTMMKNIGVDFYLFKSRINGSFDLFRNDITNLLGEANTDALSMFSTYPINGAHQRREGWDASLNTTNIKTTDFSWNSVLNLSKYNSIWIERMPNFDYKEYQIRENEPTLARYYYETAGIINIDRSNAPASQPEGANYPGYPIIVDQNGDGEITVEDVVMSNEVPDIYFGFGNTFGYKNFELNIFMYSQLGVSKYNYAWDLARPAGLANQTNSITLANETWNSQTNTNGTRPGIALALSNVSLPSGASTDINYQDASFLRVRNITLAYNVGSEHLGKWGNHIRNIRIYLDAQNPILITNFEGYDPEVKSGGDYITIKAEYPQTMAFSIGAKINFK